MIQISDGVLHLSVTPEHGVFHQGANKVKVDGVFINALPLNAFFNIQLMTPDNEKVQDTISIILYDRKRDDLPYIKGKRYVYIREPGTYYIKYSYGVQNLSDLKEIQMKGEQKLSTIKVIDFQSKISNDITRNARYLAIFIFIFAAPPAFHSLKRLVEEYIKSQTE